MENTFTVLFSCSEDRKVDPKSRVAVLSDWPIAHGAKLWMLQAENKKNRVLKCYTKETFESMVQEVRQVCDERGISPARKKAYIGDIIARSKPVEVNSQGKLLIPKAAKEYLHLQEYATLVGRGEYFEIWEKDTYDTYMAASDMADNELEKIFGIFT